MLIVGTAIPVIYLHSQLINKVPSYFPIRHKKYVLSPGCDLVVGICYNLGQYNNCITNLEGIPGYLHYLYSALSALRPLEIEGTDCMQTLVWRC